MKRIALLIAIGLTCCFAAGTHAFSLPSAEGTSSGTAVIQSCENDLIEVMFENGSAVRLRNGTLVDLKTNALEGLDAVLQQVAWYRWQRLTDLPESTIDAWETTGEQNTGTDLYNLNNIYWLKIPPSDNIREIAASLEALPGIYMARPVPKPTPPPIPPNYQTNQGYLYPASNNPSGVDALYAWTQTGGTGTGVTVCDLEYSWNYNHGDITKALGSQINTGVITDPFNDNNHGTAVIGELVADNNGWGITGICYGATLKTCATNYNGGWNVPGAIMIAMGALTAGDIILIEQQWDYTGSGGNYIPIEWWNNYSPSAQTNNAVYSAIVTAIANGIHVVEAGGNGNYNTDLLQWYGNSGAIIVGAGGATTSNNLKRIIPGTWGSSYGSRFDMQGWGENVFTTGYGYYYSTDGVNYYYTATFSGTSSASPIVAGALACAEGWYEANLSTTPTPAYMRSQLKSTGTAQVTPPAGNIGPRPNIKGFIQSIPLPTLDFGDAPDGPYPTLLGTNGARHTNTGLRMGNLIDSENNGQPNFFATGDDIVPPTADDEDGVTFISPLVPGQTATVQVIASAQGVLNAWMDFNMINAWADPGEQIVTNAVLNPGINILTFQVPSNTVMGPTYSRWRFSTQTGLTFTGAATNGEVEDYQTFIEEAMLDFGDAPPPYPTQLAANGARHSTGGIFLGAYVDTEPDGQPDPQALGDDATGTADDEDGVTWTCNFRSGQPNAITVTASGTGLLNAWFDWNFDGDWADPGEQVFIDLPLVSGATNLIVNVPAGTNIGATFARFRYSSQMGLSFTGGASDGEVEDYIVFIHPEEPMDYGDAPDPTYPTLLASNGARHANDPSAPFFLGALIDYEFNGQPNATATGDDLAAMADEDGVVLNTPLVPGMMATIQVTASMAGGLFQGWIDFNKDGDWLDPGEQIFANIMLVAGPQPLNFIVPPTALLGNTFARYRYSSMANLAPSGCAPNGEVEDYQYFIGQEQMDYGDAPDPTYPVLQVSNGARHNMSGLRMGATIDYEFNGQPDPQALGDDNNPAGTDDEDGVTWPCNFIIGQPNTIYVTVNGTGFLNAWFDFNGDGDWADAAEQVFTDLGVGAGTWNFIVFCPGGFAGNTFARFRFSSVQGLGYTGLAPDGEVEDYMVTIRYEEPMDFGDAPDPLYPTLLTSDGARHTNPMAGQNILLGNLIDWEMNGQPVPAGLGDDQNNLADEDGVIIPVLNPGVMATLQVTTTGGGGFLQGWIDFNADGDWYDPGEQIASNFPMLGGMQPLTFMVPAGATLGNTFARFRYSTMQNLGINGCAPDGEVEDYPVLIQQQQAPMDFGDAPDPTYPTLLANNGARHVNTGLMLGWMIDVEPDGQPDATATKDDTIPMGFDDEDGVWWPCNFMPGHANTVKVTTNGPGLLSAWFDWNIDGDWSDPGEKVFTDIALLPGTTDLVVTPPAGAVTDTTFARFRFSTQAALNDTGPAPDGEVEDHLIVVQPAEEMDYGDAPDSFYQTLAASNGARHLNFPGMPVFMGNLIDWEADGQPTPLANGDDINNLADEDGVMLNTPLMPGVMAVITVTASIGGAALQGWIDFNQDGDWLDPGEQVFTNAILVAGAQPLNFLVPAAALPGNTYARFRYSTMGNLAPYGCAPNGEVEDYFWCVGEIDYGDAPDPGYPTLLIRNGARHLIDQVTWLGGPADAEPNGQPNPGALGDDNAGIDDEDGVAFMWPMAKGNPCKIKVTASVGNALFNAWIDYNNNGSWAEPNEHIFVDLNLQAGVNYLTFIVPRAAKQGLAYARFRFSHQPALSFTGYAFDGEVEDYAHDVIKYAEIKWEQPPDPLFPGIHANDNIKLADDWRCNGGLVTDIHWWGNYEIDGTGNEKRGAGISHFILAICKNAGCLPGSPILTWAVPFTAGLEMNTGLINNEGSPIYKYDFNLPDYFIQIRDTTYWLMVQAISNNIQNPPSWRWQESNRWMFPILCGGARESGTGWQTISWPFGSLVKYSDFAFRLTTWVVDSLDLQNMVISSGQNLCFDATGVITLAGGGSTFVVQPGGSVTLIAGQKIRFLPGTWAQSGSYVHGYITTTGQYCSSLEAPLVTGVNVEKENEAIGAARVGTKFIAYPNPTTGDLTLKPVGDPLTDPVTVEVYDMMGGRVLREVFGPGVTFGFSLAAQSPGIYLLRVMTGTESATVKVVKR